ncbi:MAG: hypothetical protein BGO98_28745 [Myxococcales bacterium 68-20]|nr:MAG: hypothetical protein BGO98_28745 [Myxococcales bacterium 68-20]
MIPRIHGAGRRRIAVALAPPLTLLSMGLVSIQGCATASEAAPPVEEDAVVVVPSPDSGDPDGGSAEASIPDDAATDKEAPCGVGNLCRVQTPLASGSIAAMSGRSKNDVWATGSSGFIMRWDGQQWLALEPGGPDTLTNIFLTPDELWGVAGNLIVRRNVDPTSIRDVRWFSVGEHRYLTGIAVLANGDPFVLRSASWESGTAPDCLAKIQNFDAGDPESVAAPVLLGTELAQELSPRALHLVPNKALWIVGDHARVARYSMTSAGLGPGVVVPVDSQANLLAAWGEGDQLWATGGNGTILHYDGTRWHAADTGTTVTLRAIFGFSSKDIWAAGDQGTVLHYDGTTWSPVSARSDRDLRAIWGSAPDDVWIAGERSIFHWGALP